MHQIGGYTVERQLGAGGMGVVWLAKHQILGRYVAIKTLNDGFAQQGDFRQRFLNEARFMAKLAHPNIVQVLDLINIEDNVGIVTGV